MPKLVERELQAHCYALQKGPDDLARIPRGDLARMLLLLYLVREFETAVLDLNEQELVHGPAHTSVGQEAIAAATAVTLRKSDMVGSTHRAHGHFLSKAVIYYAPDGYDPLEQPFTEPMQEAVTKTLAEIMGLREGWCGGHGGSMHLYDGRSGNLGSNAIVGGGIPLATGAAWAERLRERDSVVVSFFGDGAINQGCFHEVANMARLWDVPILYFVENNRYAVGTSIEEASCQEDLALRSLSYRIPSYIVDGMDPVALYWALQDVTSRMRKKPGPYFIEAKTWRHYHHAGRIPGSAYGYRTKQEEADWWERDPLATFPREMLAAGLLSKEEARLREMAIASVEAARQACVVQQGETWTIPAALWPDPATITHDLRGPSDLPAEARVLESQQMGASRTVSYVEAIAAVTRRAMERDERVFVLGEEVANLGGGAYQATKGLADTFPGRVINTPISEAGFVGMAGGAASVGLRPVVEIMFPDFALVAADQLFNQIGKLRHMYGGRASFPVVARTRIAIGFGYGGQHSSDPASLFALFSGWRVMAPSNAFDYVGMFNTAMHLEDPVLMLEHGQLYGSKSEIPTDDLDYMIPYGSGKIVRPGSDVTVLTYLTGVRDSLAAAERLASEGLQVEIIDLRTLDLVGMDWELIGASLAKTGSVLVVEQSPHSMCLGPRIAGEIQRRFFDDLDCPVNMVSADDVPYPVSKALEVAMIPSVDAIYTRMAESARHQV
ncbi:MAG: alpha-ketoacid dehydrogenase subunit alpha/beta [Anaerolineae bacterium]